MALWDITQGAASLMPWSPERGSPYASIIKYDHVAPYDTIADRHLKQRERERKDAEQERRARELAIKPPHSQFEFTPHTDAIVDKQMEGKVQALNGKTPQERAIGYQKYQEGLNEQKAHDYAMDQLNGNFKKAQGAIADKKNYINEQSAYNGIQNKLFSNNGMSPLPATQLPVNSFTDEAFHPEHFEVTPSLRDYASKLHNDVQINGYANIGLNGGTKSSSTIAANDLYERDQNGNIKLVNGRPIYNLNNQIVEGYYDTHPRAQAKVRSELAKEGYNVDQLEKEDPQFLQEKERQFLHNKLQPFASYKQSKTFSTYQKENRDSQGNGTRKDINLSNGGSGTTRVYQPTKRDGKIYFDKKTAGNVPYAAEQVATTKNGHATVGTIPIKSYIGEDGQRKTDVDRPIQIKGIALRSIPVPPSGTIPILSGNYENNAVEAIADAIVNKKNGLTPENYKTSLKYEPKLYGSFFDAGNINNDAPHEQTPIFDDNGKQIATFKTNTNAYFDLNDNSMLPLRKQMGYDPTDKTFLQHQSDFTRKVDEAVSKKLKGKKPQGTSTFVPNTGKFKGVPKNGF